MIIAAGFEGPVVAESRETPVAVGGDDEGGDCGGEWPHGGPRWGRG